LSDAAIVPFAPFPHPVPVPSGFGTGTVFCCYDTAWFEYIQGSLKVLLALSTWDTTDSATRLEIIGRASDLMSDLCGGCTIADYIQFRQTDCALEVSYDMGETWSSVFTQCPVDGAPFVVLNPLTNYRNFINPTTPDVSGLQIAVTGGAYGVYIRQDTHEGSADDVQALRVIASQGPCARLDGSVGPVLLINPVLDNPAIGLRTGILVDGNGRLLIQSTADVPPGSDTRGTLWLGLDDNGDDNPYFIAWLHDDTYEIRSLKGADGAPGADGAGITVVTFIEGDTLSEPTATLTNAPDIQHQQLDLTIPTPPVIETVEASGLASTEPPTVDLTTLEDGNLHLAFGIPAGEPGAPGEPGTVTFPDLPTTTGDSVTFDMIMLADGTALPWVVPSGYRVKIMSTKGRWSQTWVASGTHTYVTLGSGGSDVDLDGLKFGSIVAVTSEIDGNGQTDSASAEGIFNGFSELTMPSDRVIVYQQKERTEAQLRGYIIATVRVTAQSGFDWQIILDFLTESYSGIGVNQVAGNGGGYGCDYVSLRGAGYYSGEGWSSGKSGFQCGLRVGLNGGDGTSRLQRVEVQGHCAFPNGNYYTRIHDIYAWNSDYTLDAFNIVTDGTQDAFDLPQPQAINSHYVFDVNVNAQDHSTPCPGSGYPNDQEVIISRIVLRGSGTIPTLHTW